MAIPLGLPGFFDPEVSRDVLHVPYDAMVKMQVDNNEPPEIREYYEKLCEKGFTEFEAIHTLIPALSETLYTTKKNEPFDKATYLKLASEYVTPAPETNCCPPPQVSPGSAERLAEYLMLCGIAQHQYSAKLFVELL